MEKIRGDFKENYDKYISAISNIAIAVVSILALVEYKITNDEAVKANMIACQSKLDEFENRIVCQLPENDFLNAVWVYSDKRHTTIKEDADAKLKALLCENGASGKKDLGFQWTNVEELELQLWSEDSFKPDNARKLKPIRQAYNMLEQVLYLVESAYYAQEAGMLPKDAIENYAAYIDDIGCHPLFLEAIYFRHYGGYFQADFARFLKTRIENKPENKAIAEKLYPEMFNNPKWAEETGAWRYKSCEVKPVHKSVEEL